MSTSSPLLSLLTPPSYSRQAPTSYFVSIFVHGAVIGLVYFAVLFAPRIDTHAPVRFNMRQLDLHVPDSELARLRSGADSFPGPPSADKSAGTRGDEASHRPSPKLIPHTKVAPQTLLQPDLKIAAMLDHELPLPKVVLWSAKKLEVKKIEAPKPVKPPSVEVKPQIDIPNQEVKLADIPLASTSNMALHPIVTASNTTPMALPHPSQQIDVTPVSTTQTQLQPTPTAVMSLSDITMKDANVALPPVNQAAKGDVNGSMAAANAKPLPGPGNESAAQNAAGNGNSKTAGIHPGMGTSNAANLAGAGGGESHNPSSGGGKSPQPGGGGNGASNGSGQKTGNGAGDDDRLTATKISRPPDGRFGAVVTGTSLEDQFPEMGSVWHARMAYTVYLHVGLAKSWILQYALPRTADAAQAGSIGQLDAPWPFNIVRPNLAPGSIDSDALMVHGYVNTTGRFENLDVVFPPAFPLTQFVLQSLSQWQFRPAMQDGKPVRTEILLVIPDEDE